MRNIWILWLALAGFACGDDSTDTDTSDAFIASDGGRDLGARDASMPDGGPEPDGGLAPDGGLESDAGSDAGSDDGGPEDGGMEDAFVPSCRIPTTAGPAPGSLTVEPCSVVGDPLRARDFIDALDGLAVAPDGAILVTLQDQGPIRLVDDAAPGCRLTRDTAFAPPTTFDWGPVEVSPDGTVYLVSASSGSKAVAFFGARTGSCPLTAGLGFGKSSGVGDDGILVGNSAIAPAVLYDTNTCTTTAAPFGPDQVRAATRVDGDYVLVSGSECRVDRIEPDGTVVFSSAVCTSANDIAPCGSDLCFARGGAARLEVLDGATGAEGTPLAFADLFGPEAPTRAARIAATPDGATVVVGFEQDHPDAACDGEVNVLLYRLSGF